MVTKKTGISRDLIIHPGEYIYDIIEDRDISQADLAIQTGVSEAYVSKVINGKKPISSKFAMALEYALGTPKSFWINLQANYEAELIEYEQTYTITEEEREAKTALKEVIAYLRKLKIMPLAEKPDDIILSLRRALQVSNLGSLKALVPFGAFRISDKHHVDPYVMGAWLRICQIKDEGKIVSGTFDKSKIASLIAELKPIMFKGADVLEHEISSVMSNYGIGFSIVKNFKGAPVQGYIAKRKDGNYRMAVTIRGAYAGIFWFTLFHELGHLINDDLIKSSKFVDLMSQQNENSELDADSFARNALLEESQYNSFVQARDFSYPAILDYAKGQSVPEFIVIERLQKEKLIGYQIHSEYKVRYKWA